MDHGRFGPPGAKGGRVAAVNKVEIRKSGEIYVPPHLSKDQNISLKAGDVIRVRTPGGGGFGLPSDREPSLVERDVARGYFSEQQAASQYDVVFASGGVVDHERTRLLRNQISDKAQR
jgi:N-methylhydantoinase B